MRLLSEYVIEDQDTNDLLPEAFDVKVVLACAQTSIRLFHLRLRLIGEYTECQWLTHSIDKQI